MNENKLTHLQKTALEGEIAYALSTSMNNADLKLRIYMILKEIPMDLLGETIQIIKKAVTFDEAIVDRIFLEITLGKVPEWLWLERAIADLHDALKIITPDMSDSKLSINKTEERKKLIKSAFISFGRKAFLMSPKSAQKLFKAVSEDEKLSFLSTCCFYLSSRCEEVINNYKVDDEPREELLNVHFDLRDTMNPMAEIKSIEELEKNPLQNNKSVKDKLEAPANKKTIKSEVVLIEGEISPSELSNFISEKVIELFSKNQPVTRTKKEPKIKYVVQKVFKDSNVTTDIDSFDTEEEAQKYIEQMKKKYPDILITGDLIIVKK